ncbi:MAG: glycosyl hydrolase family 79 C-terminal domain-containing protein [Solirubrobacteraceae bacterium]
MNAWRRSPFFHFDVVVVSIVAVLIIGFSLASAGGDADAPSPGATGHATAVTIDPGANDPAVPQGFLGLSIEYPALEAYAGSDPSSLDPVFEQLVRNLAPGQAPVLRIGGNSADRAWWPMAGVSRPPGVTFDITPQWLRVTHALAQKLSARLILGVNLEQDSPQLASAEAQALVNGVGRQSVRALELGNEPDLYSAFPWYRADGHAVFGRPRSYDESEYISDFDGLSGALPRVPLAGPSLSGRQWTQGLGQFLAVESHLGLVTLHRYPLQVCLTPRTSARYPTIARLLSPATSTDLAKSFAPYVALARAHGLSLRVDELNTVSCGADPAVSKSFASALWALNTLFGLASVGVSGVNVHTFPGAGYELFQIAHTGGTWRAAVSPEYYGMLMFAQATPPGSRILNVTPTGIPGVNVWATRATDGTVRVVLTNEGSGAHDIAIHMTGKFQSATLARLIAPSATATSGVTLAGQSFGSATTTGRLSGSSQQASVSGDDGRYEITLPAASAAMLVLSPRDPAHR